MKDRLFCVFEDLQSGHAALRRGAPPLISPGQGWASDWLSETLHSKLGGRRMAKRTLLNNLNGVELDQVSWPTSSLLGSGRRMTLGSASARQPRRNGGGRAKVSEAGEGIAACHAIRVVLTLGFWISRNVCLSFRVVARLSRYGVSILSGVFSPS
jgi:hypothetical protein